ncbi:hypothetical protein SLE2022_248220 [Rubroshorea leprosula]
MAVMEPVIFTEKDEMWKWSRSMRSQGKTIGLVPPWVTFTKATCRSLKKPTSTPRKGWFHVWRRGEWGTKQGLELRDWREDILCGKNRPVFFRGVATIVTKLFNIVEPDVAVFGKKDYHQWRIIQRMVRDPDFGIEIVGSDIVRDSDGLALSSRNVHLSPEEREKALSINRIDYAEIVKQGSLEAVEGIKNPVVFCIAAWFGKVRLIDNIEISI